MAKNYTRGKAQKQLWSKDWIQLFKLFNTPSGTYKQMHDHAYRAFVHVARAFAAMPPRAFREAGCFKNAVEMALNMAV